MIDTWISTAGTRPLNKFLKVDSERTISADDNVGAGTIKGRNIAHWISDALVGRAINNEIIKLRLRRGSKLRSEIRCGRL